MNRHQSMRGGKDRWVTQQIATIFFITFHGAFPFTLEHKKIQ
jgi:hypothetical protein